MTDLDLVAVKLLIVFLIHMKMVIQALDIEMTC